MEISYNDSEAKSERYRATIEFISAKDWEDELRTLLSDVHHDDSDGMGEESPARIAYHKLRAIYPNLKKEDLAKGKVAFRPLRNLEGSELQDLLGTSLDIAHSNKRNFSSELHKYIYESPQDEGDARSSAVTRFWPLIKVVKIFVKANILKCGLTLVDLVRHSS